jgi:hypothetical protein
MGYALRNWVALTRYTEDGLLKIDNNGAEQALRPIVLGRKNWLFAGSEAAGHRTAILSSLVQTCKHLQTNPFVYPREVTERVSTHPACRVLELTPRVEAPAAGFRRTSRRLNDSFLSRNPWDTMVPGEITDGRCDCDHCPGRFNKSTSRTANGGQKKGEVCYTGLPSVTVGLRREVGGDDGCTERGMEAGNGCRSKGPKFWSSWSVVWGDACRLRPLVGRAGFRR